MITMSMTQWQLCKYHKIHLVLPFNIILKHLILKTGIKKMIFLHILQPENEVILICVRVILNFMFIFCVTKKIILCMKTNKIRFPMENLRKNNNKTIGSSWSVRKLQTFSKPGPHCLFSYLALQVNLQTPAIIKSASNNWLTEIITYSISFCCF